jgi:hypothetical protein
MHTAFMNTAEELVNELVWLFHRPLTNKDDPEIPDNIGIVKQSIDFSTIH